MAFKHTDDPSTPTNDTRTRLLVRHAAEGFDVLELRRQMGKAGYVPTEHKWEDDGGGDDLTDEDGSVLLIGGMPPADLASEIVETARLHVDETNDRKNYRVVALRRSEGENGDEEEEEVFRFLLPATMFGGGMPDPATGSDARENHDALMAANRQTAAPAPERALVPDADGGRPAVPDDAAQVHRAARAARRPARGRAAGPAAGALDPRARDDPRATLDGARPRQATHEPPREHVRQVHRHRRARPDGAPAQGLRDGHRGGPWRHQATSAAPPRPRLPSASATHLPGTP